ncbi:hypothetical protein ACHAW6_009971 [Cyclotella cf. meneghiniana]
MEGHVISKNCLHTHKKELNCTHGKKDGNLNNNLDDVDTLMANFLLIKKFLNNVIFTPRAWFVNTDLLYIYLMMPKWPEFARLDLRNIPEEIIDDINLCKIAPPQQMGLHHGSLHHNLLKERMNHKGYFQSKKVPGHWKQKDQSIQFVGLILPIHAPKFGETLQFDKYNGSPEASKVVAKLFQMHNRPNYHNHETSKIIPGQLYITETAKYLSEEQYGTHIPQQRRISKQKWCKKTHCRKFPNNNPDKLNDTKIIKAII